ncbi:MAG: hypothetical protein LUO93_08855 [Methanomicrobiales archaeon]|nr:hypothetical protein [Methanomicrobiales archaeon]
MALGEEILLYKAEDAEELVRFAKKHKCGASKRVLTSIHTEMNLKGSIRTFLSFVQEMQSKESIGDSPERKDVYLEAADEMHHRSKVLEEFLTSHKAGDRLDQGPEWERLQQLTGSEASEQTSLCEEDESFLHDRYLTLILLQENSLIEPRDDGMYLRGTIDPEEAITEYPADLLLEPESDDLATHGITRLITTYSETVYPVTLGPESVLMLELDELEKFGQSREVEEDSFSRALMNLALKKMIVDKVILFLREKKKTSREEILAQMKDFELAIPDTIDHFSFHLHTSFIDELLDDLRKIRTIQGKDSRIRFIGE